MKIGLTLFVIFVLSSSLLVVNEFVVYEKYDYNIDVILTHLELALRTHDINAKVSYIENTINMLEPYHGNSEWWFPNERTDIDKTKVLLETIALDVYEQNEIKDKDGYLVLPHNELNDYLNQEIKYGLHKINDYGYSMHMNPHNNPYLYILVIVVISSFIGFIIRWLDLIF